MITLESSTLKGMEYLDDGTLYLEFPRTGVYTFTDVPKEIVTEFLESDSKGSYFKRNIQGQYPWKKGRVTKA